jgi:hypothetical protein
MAASRAPPTRFGAFGQALANAAEGAHQHHQDAHQQGRLHRPDRRELGHVALHRRGHAWQCKVWLARTTVGSSG